MKNNATDYASARIRSSASPIGRIIFLATATGIILGIVAFGASNGATKASGPAIRMKRALSAAAKASIGSGYPLPGWPNPYKNVLRILRADGGKLSAHCKARALTLYAGFIGSRNPYGGTPHSYAWYREEEESILLRAVKVDPDCHAPRVALAITHQHLFGTPQEYIYDKYLADALRVDPTSGCANYLRAVEIMSLYGGHGLKDGASFHGNAGFASKKWVNAFCYRALFALRGLGIHRGISYPPPFNIFYSRSLIRKGLRYYQPLQYAELQAGTWKPGPCPDPFPPPVKKSSSAKTKPALVPTDQ